VSTGGESYLSPGRSLRRLGFVRDSDCSVDRGSPGIIGWLGWLVRSLDWFLGPFVSDNGRVCRIISIYFFLAVMHVVLARAVLRISLDCESARVAPSPIELTESD
jgi:hypothetical protein